MSTSRVQVALSRELLSPELETLEGDFYKKALKSIREARSSGDKVTAELLANSLKLLLIVRVQKELQLLVRKGEVPSGIPEEERAVVECVRRVLSSLEENEAREEGRAPPPGGGSAAAPFLSSEKPTTSEPSEAVLVSFLKPFSKIIDRGVSLGPFKRGDVARISKKTAEELAKGGYVEIISSF